MRDLGGDELRKVSLARASLTRAPFTAGAQLDAASLFWFKEPRLVLKLFQYLLFENSLSVALALFNYWEVRSTDGVPWDQIAAIPIEGVHIRTGTRIWSRSYTLGHIQTHHLHLVYTPPDPHLASFTWRTALLSYSPTRPCAR
eukprot:4354155-Pyramimonas_sp.AAC.1